MEVDSGFHRRKRRGVCYNCGATDHYQMDCPEPSKLLVKALQHVEKTTEKAVDAALLKLFPKKDFPPGQQ
jgi:hypothetical protein